MRREGERRVLMRLPREIPFGFVVPPVFVEDRVVFTRLDDLASQAPERGAHPDTEGDHDEPRECVPNEGIGRARRGRFRSLPVNDGSAT